MVTVSPEDLQFLLDEYKEAKKDQLHSTKENDDDLFYLNKGISYGLEMALIRMGVSNDELDEISRQAYQEAQE